MDERDDDTVTFMLKEDMNGRKVYTLHTEENNQFHFDGEDAQEIITDDPLVEKMLRKRIKMERADTMEDDDEMNDQDIDPEPSCIIETYEDINSEQVVEEGGEIVIQGEEDVTEELVYEGSDDVGDTGVEVTSTGKRKREADTDALGVLTQHMDIREPLNTLRQLLEDRLNIKLTDYKFWLQDAQMLEGHKNLVDQCVQGEGLVQVNVQIKTSQKRINIVDVLKPAEDYPEPLSGALQVELEVQSDAAASNASSVEPKQNVVRWVVDNNYKKDQERLKIPADPNDWSTAHVRHWLQWAVRTFNLSGVRLADWNITGRMLCELTLADFQAKVPHDPGDLFWTHLELLRKCKFVAVVQKTPESIKYIAQQPEGQMRGRGVRVKQQQRHTAAKLPRIIGMPHLMIEATTIQGAVGNRTGNNGQIQLWQFLLDLLTDKEHTDVISWITSDGEFKLKNPEMVAQLWGERKNKPTMNYEKLSRALRYYYDGDMISKVHGKRFVYKFVCDMKQLMGYSASELNRLVTECAHNSGNNNNINNGVMMYDDDES